MQLQADRLPKSPGDAATKWRRLRQFFIHAASNRDCKKKVRDTLHFNSACVCSTCCIYELSGESGS